MTPPHTRSTLPCLAVVALLVSGCLEQGTTRCADGVVCPAGTVCAPAGASSRCVLAAQLEACTGLAEGAPCVSTGVPEGACRGGVCAPVGGLLCGNGRLDGAEGCDCGADASSQPEDCRDPNSDEPDVRCRPDCTPRRCGDGVADLGSDEVCDDGNNVSGDGCSSDCLSDETCGNGRVDPLADPPELCDCGLDPDPAAAPAGCLGPNADEPDALCRLDCTPRRCGDGVVDETYSEACDCGDGAGPLPPDCAGPNSDAPDADCRTNCLPARCGDGVVDDDDDDDPTTGEVCDDGNNDSGDHCSYDCRSDETCGNGYVDAVRGELCDDFNLAGRDGCGSNCLPEQPSWSLLLALDGVPGPGRRYRHAMAYDPDRGVVVALGSEAAADEALWLWDGLSWRAVRLPGPGARSQSAIAYDARRGRLVHFGGFRGDRLVNDTWEWDGVAWRDESRAVSPPPRFGHAMAYDSARGRIVLFGGNSVGVYFDDTWEWDGEDWHRADVPVRPVTRSGHAMAYDPRRGQVVLFGGYKYSDHHEFYGDTWVLDGSWTERAVTPAPAPRYGHAMAFDAGRGVVALHGGYDAAGRELADTWEWDGAAWRDVTALSPAIPARRLGGMAYDTRRGRLVLYGGFRAGAAIDELLERDGLVWGGVEGPAGIVGAEDAAMAFDTARGRAVLVAGGATFEWDGRSWIDRSPATQPPAYDAPAMAYDPGRERTVLVGGGAPGAPLATWEWDGVDWTDIGAVVPPPPAPPARGGAALAYDVHRGELLLFGGQDDSGIPFADTWVRDAAGWRDVSPAAGSPPARAGHGLAHDAGSGGTLLFGGHDGVADLGDTWEWDGLVWRPLAPLVAPPPRGQAPLAHEPVRGRVLLHGGVPLDRLGLDDTWEWDAEGETWSWLGLSPRPVGDTRALLAYDAPRWQTLFFGVSDDGGITETWALRWAGPGGQETCEARDVDGDGLLGCADPDCWPLCAPLCPPGAPCDPSAPRCGDGACGPVESCRTCPGDCGPCAALCGDFVCDGGETVTDCPGDCTP